MPSAPWRRAPAPRAGGGRAAFRFGWGGGAGRRRQAHEQGPAACGALGDAALPWWARGAAGVRVRRCLPCGQRRFRVGAPDFGVSRKEARFRNVSPIKGFPGAPGNGLLPARSGVFPARRHPYALPMSLSPQETEIRAISPSKHVLPPTKPSTFIHPWQMRPVTSRVSSPPHFAANIRRASNPIFPPFPSPPHPPTIPRGERRALPAPAQGTSPLGIPFWGTGLTFPPSPRPPKRRRRQAPARGLAAVNSHHRPIRNETQNARPLLVGRAFVYFEPTALAGRTAARRSSMRA